MINEIAVIGLGHIGKIHVRLLKQNPLWKLVGVYDLDANLTREMAEMFGVKAYVSLEECMAQSQVIAISTPTSSHFEIAKAAIILGKHIYIEKPVTPALKEAKLLQSLIKEAAIICQVGHVERNNPAFIAAQPYLLDPVFIEVHRLAQYNLRGTDVSVVLDLMMHDLDLLLHTVKSNVRKIHANGAAIVSQTADLVSTRIEFENGCVANLTTNRVALRNVRKFRVFTRNNLVNINLLDKHAEIIRIKDAVPESTNIIIDRGIHLNKKEIQFEYPIILPLNAINEEFNTFYESIHSNKAISFGINDAIRTQEIAAEIEEKLHL